MLNSELRVGCLWPNWMTQMMVRVIIIIPVLSLRKPRLLVSQPSLSCAPPRPSQGNFPLIKQPPRAEGCRKTLPCWGSTSSSSEVLLFWPLLAGGSEASLRHTHVFQRGGEDTGLWDVGDFTVGYRRQQMSLVQDGVVEREDIRVTSHSQSAASSKHRGSRISFGT